MIKTFADKRTKDLYDTGRAMRVDSVLEGTDSPLFEGPVITLHEGRTDAALDLGAQNVGMGAPAHGRVTPSDGRTRRGFTGGASTWK